MAGRTGTVILGLLTSRPMTGYELKTAVENSTGNFWSESFGQIYPELRQLTERGLIEATDEEEGRSKRRYAITAAGQEVLRDWLAEPPRHNPPRDELLLKIFFARHGDLGQVIGHVAEARRICAAKLKALESKERDLKQTYAQAPSLPFWLMTIRNGQLSYAATIAWCDETLAELERLNSAPSSSIQSKE
jgi:DNA-binding PadR family transcriptional regulator